MFLLRFIIYVFVCFDGIIYTVGWCPLLGCHVLVMQL